MHRSRSLRSSPYASEMEKFATCEKWKHFIAIKCVYKTSVSANLVYRYKPGKLVVWKSNRWISWLWNNFDVWQRNWLTRSVIELNLGAGAGGKERNRKSLHRSQGHFNHYWHRMHCLTMRPKFDCTYNNDEELVTDTIMAFECRSNNETGGTNTQGALSVGVVSGRFKISNEKIQKVKSWNKRAELDRKGSVQIR